MSTNPSEQRLIYGRLDQAGRLISADPQLELLQQQAGGQLGTPIAIPQLAALVRSAAELDTALYRVIAAATEDQDLELGVHVEPNSNGLDVRIDRWVGRSPAPARLNFGPANAETKLDVRMTWKINERLELVDVSQDFAELLGRTAEELIGRTLTAILDLETDEGGKMPLLSSLAMREPFEGQKAKVRGDEIALVLAGQMLLDEDGAMLGLSGTAELEEALAANSAMGAWIDPVLDETLSSPLDRIIAEAEEIVAQKDGPLQAAYAEYGNDIASAARHLLSILRPEHHEQMPSLDHIDLVDTVQDAVTLVAQPAEQKLLSIQVQATRSLWAKADHQLVRQILVNILGNAIRHSPTGGKIHVLMGRDEKTVRVSVQDEGSGVPLGFEERVFERFERATNEGTGSGLGLAISRTLARRMGGDLTLYQQPGRGARFELRLFRADTKEQADRPGEGLD